MKKMAFVDLSNFTDWPVGGMIRYEMQILEVLANFYEIELWGVSLEKKCPKPVKIQGKKYPVHIFTNVKKKRRWIPNYWKGLNIGRFRQHFDKYDIIYIHTGSCAVAAAFLFKTKENLLVYHQHGLMYLDDFSLKSLLQRPFMYLAQRMTDFSFVVTGKEELNQYAATKSKSFRKKLVQIASPVEKDMEQSGFTEAERKGNLFIYVGRLAPIKRVPMIVEAFRMFSERHGKAFRLLIVGDGEERRKVQKAVEKSGLKDRIILTGNVEKEEVKKYLQQAALYITASKGEGVSVAVLEAFRAGVPVVCYPVRGLAEQVCNEKTGMIAKEHTLEAFVNAMERAMERRSVLVKNCKEEYRKYTPDAIGNQIREEIERRYERKKNKCHRACL